MGFISRIFVFLVLSLLILASGCTQIAEKNSKQNTGDPHIGEIAYHDVSGPMIINKSGYYRLTQDIKTSRTTGRKYQLSCIDIKASDVVFDGMGHTIDGSLIHPKDFESSTGIDIDNWNPGKPVTHVTIRNITVSNWTNGISLRGAKDLSIENARGVDNGIGFFLISSSNISMRNTHLDTNGEGVEGQDVEKISFIDGTIATSRGSAIFLDGQTQQNTFINLPGFFYVLPFYHYEKTGSGNGHIISENEITHSRDGIFLRNSNNNLIMNNVIRDSGSNGVRLDKVDNSVISQNYFENWGTFGISLHNCGFDNVITNNSFAGSNKSMGTLTYPDSLPFSLIIGTILVYLLKVLGGASNIYRKIQEGRIYKWIKRKTRSFEENIQSKTQGRILKFSENPLFITLIGAIIFGGAFAFVRSVITADIFYNLVFVSGIVTVTPRAIQFFIARKNGIPLEYRIWWGGILIILITMFIPRIIFGQPVRTDLEEEERYDKKKLALTKLAGPIICIVLSIVFFLIYLMKGPYAAIGLEGLQMSLLSSFVMLLPISPMEGERVVKWNKLIWGVLFFSVLIAYGYLLLIL